MNNKVVLVTGASRGIGRAIALDLASNEYNVVINYFSNDSAAKEVENKINKEYNNKCMIYKADVSNEEEVKSMIDAIILEYGRIDVLVNNAGIAIDTLVEEKTITDFEKILKINLIGAFNCSRECAKHMDKGVIINIASTNGIDTYYPYGLDYDASKAGLISLTKNLAAYYAPNIRVNAVAPGWVNTDAIKQLDENYFKQECEKILLKRFGEPEEIANVVSFLVSDKASFINGEIIRVDGGK